MNSVALQLFGWVMLFFGTFTFVSWAVIKIIEKLEKRK